MEKNRDLPEGGWGWLCVLGSAIVHVLFGLINRAFGVFYVDFKQRFETTNSVVGALGALAVAVFGLFSPIVGRITDKIGCRLTTIIGGFIVSGSFILTGYVTHISMVFVTVGCSLSIGLALCFSPSYIAVNSYFLKRRGIAMGLSTLGSGVGCLAAPIVEVLLDNYGYSGFYLIMGGLSFHLVFSGTVYRLYKPITTIESIVVENQEEQSNEKKEEIFKEFPKKDEKISLMKSWRSLLGHPLFQSVLVTQFTICSMSGGLGAFLVAFSVDRGNSREKSSFIITSLAAGDIIGRVLFGFLTDLKPVRNYRSHFLQACMTTVGIITILFPVGTNFGYFLIVSGL